MIYKRGSRGEMVRQIQKALAGAGLKVIADGIFGAITEEAVREFQRKKGLKVDGIVGPATLALLIPPPPEEEQPHHQRNHHTLHRHA